MRRNKVHALLLLVLCSPALLNACGGGGETGGGDGRATNTAAAPAPSPAQPAQTKPASPPQRVTATAEEARLEAGGSGEAVVRLDIAEGYHVHANPASDKFYVATEVRAEPQEGITPGRPVYPAAKSMKFSFSDKPLAVYEGRVVVRLPLRAEASAAKGRHTVRAKVRVQPCNDLACEPPRDIEAAIPVTVN